MAELGFEGMLPLPEAAATASADEAAEQLEGLSLPPQQPVEPPPPLEGDGTDFFDNDGTPLSLMSRAAAVREHMVGERSRPGFGGAISCVLGADGRELEEPAVVPSPKAAVQPSGPAAAASAAAEVAGENEDAIQRALFVGNFSAALDACFEVTPHPKKQVCKGEMQRVHLG